MKLKVKLRVKLRVKLKLKIEFALNSKHPFKLSPAFIYIKIDRNKDIRYEKVYERMRKRQKNNNRKYEEM